MLVYTSSSFVEQTTPTGFKIFDMKATVTSVNWVGKDLDLVSLKGDVNWNAPEDVPRVNSYYVYLAYEASGRGRSQVTSSAVPVGTNTIAVPPTVMANPYTFFTVYTSSVLVEQTTPADLSFSAGGQLLRTTDTALVDDDLDRYEAGGNITWTAPKVLGLIAQYNIHLADDELSGNHQPYGFWQCG